MVDAGDGRRAQRNEVLCAVDRVHSSATCKAVKDVAAAHMTRVNAGVTVSTMRIADFWDNVYIPWAREINPKVNEPNLRPSTVAGYEQVWSQHLKDHFGDATLAEYQHSSVHRAVNIGNQPYEQVTVFLLDRPDAVAEPTDE